MQYSELLYQRYLEELQALEEFKAAHTDHYTSVFQDLSEDHYTRHLIEVFSFFAARNSLLGEQKIVDLYQRLFKQYFPFLCNPLPCMSIMQMSPSKDLVEKVDCREGTEICMNSADGKKGYFQTLHPLRILPIQLNKFHFAQSKETNTKFYLHFKASIPLTDQVGDFKLYINQLNHFPSSLSLAFALKEHLKKVTISYDVYDIPTTDGINCNFSFDPPETNHLIDHPIEKIRSLLHFPEQELFFTVHAHPSAGKWNNFALCFDLGENWPEQIQLGKDTFVPFAVPIANLRRKEAAPIRCEGTADYYSILYPDPEDDFSFHSLKGVYMIENHKKVPIKPSISTQGQGTYEIETIFHSKTTASRLTLNFPDAFENPKLITAEVLWYQPWYSEELEKDIKATIVNQVMPGIDLHLIGRICPSENLSPNYNIEFFTQMLALKNQTRLDLYEVLFLMNALKERSESYFKEIPSSLKDFKVTDFPGFRSSFLVSEYSFFLEKLDDKNRDLALLYFKHMRNFLDLWLSNIDIELTVNSTQFKKTFTKQ